MRKFLPDISDILSSVRRVLISIVFPSLAIAGALAHFSNAATKSQPAQSQNPATAQNPAQQTPSQPPAQSPPAPGLRTVVIDPGHGGTDTGARGPSGVAEKDIVLEWAQAIASALRAQGFEAVMTRFGDTDPSLDDRATVANAQSSAIFISLHVGSTGPLGTVRTYTYLFPSAAPAGAGETEAAVEVPPGFLLWQEAQKPFLAQSIKLGDLIQVELAQKFKGSPEVSKSVPAAVLRSVATPAVAIEVSSIAADSQKLESISGDLAAGIARAVLAYKTIYPPGGR